MKIQIFALVVAGVIQSANGAPTVTSVSVSGDLANNSIAIISGSEFGAGPSILIYDDFEGGSGGAVIPLTSPTIGEWTAYGPPAGRPTFSIYARSGEQSMSVRDFNYSDGNRTGQFIKIFPAPVKEFFVSYSVALPSGYFPGATSPHEFPGQSSWKLAWFYDGETGYGTDGKADICTPTNPGSGLFGLMGNDGNLETNLGNSWWSWNGFTRISTWIKADPDNPTTAPGRIVFQTVNMEKGNRTKVTTDKPVFFNNQVPQFDRMTIPGWWRYVDNTQFNGVYDDIYLATGPNAFARVEVANNRLYSDATEIVIAPSSDWADDSLRVTLKKGALSDLSTAYLFVTDSQGQRNSLGYPLCQRCPKPPSSIN